MRSFVLALFFVSLLFGASSIRVTQVEELSLDSLAAPGTSSTDVSGDGSTASISSYEVIEPVSATLYEGESVAAYIPSPEDFVADAPFYAITDTTGDTYVAQILESYETSEGADVVIYNLAGEAITVEATLGSVPYTLVMDSVGDVYVAEVAESCLAVTPEVTLEIPEVVAETEVETSVEIVTSTVEGEETVVLLPETGDIIPDAPFVPITNGNTTYIAQVLESYESETGEQLVTINGGGGESITMEGEVVTPEYPFAPVITYSGEIEVVEIVETTVNEYGETIITIVDDGEIQIIYGDPIIEPSTEAPDQIICLEPGHAEEENSTEDATTDYTPPPFCGATATTTTESTSTTTTETGTTEEAATGDFLAEEAGETTETVAMALVDMGKVERSTIKAYPSSKLTHVADKRSKRNIISS